MQLQHKLGWRPDPLDPRDFKFSAPSGAAMAPSSDLSSFFPDVYDQRQCNGCTAYAGEALHRAKLKQLGLPDFEGSKQGLYTMTRVFENDLAKDDGAVIRDTILIMLSDGLIAEADWPYDLSKITQKPPQTLYHKALDQKTRKAVRVTQDGTPESRSGVHGVASLMRGDAFEFGMTLFTSFEDHKTLNSGIVPVPNLGVEKVLGGHAMDAGGHVLDSQMPYTLPNGAVLKADPANGGGYAYVRGSWGTGVSIKGWMWIPFSLIFNPDYTDDLWAIVAA